ncbi:MAG TPA: AraC family transcriptional regulator [Xanthomonadales bacterium]|nr:AraC family transcriptional regulator [Xanthomonadales bacterium]
MSFFAPAMGAYWQLLESYGLDAKAIFVEAGIDPESIYDANVRIPFKAMDHILFEGARQSRDPNFGLNEAKFFRPAHLGALGFAWLASSTLRVAFERMSRYCRMINDHLQIELSDVDDSVQVAFINNSSSRNANLREQGQLALAVKCCRVVAGENFSPRKICFRQGEPKDTSEFFAWFRCPVGFNSKFSGMLVDQQWMDQRLTGSNEQLAHLNEHIVIKYLAHLQKSDVVNRCKASIIDSLGSGGVSETKVAATLHMTPRNLHRRLQKENTSFKLLLNEVRQDLALQYIQDRSLTLTEISFMLGFSEVSSFSRAFKNWTGQAPSSMRQATQNSA